LIIPASTVYKFELLPEEKPKLCDYIHPGFKKDAYEIVIPNTWAAIR